MDRLSSRHSPSLLAFLPYRMLLAVSSIRDWRRAIATGCAYRKSDPNKLMDAPVPAKSRASNGFSHHLILVVCIEEGPQNPRPIPLTQFLSERDWRPTIYSLT